jgi:hypothetical protein
MVWWRYSSTSSASELVGNELRYRLQTSETSSLTEQSSVRTVHEAALASMSVWTSWTRDRFSALSGNLNMQSSVMQPVSTGLSLLTKDLTLWCTLYAVSFLSLAYAGQGTRQMSQASRFPGTIRLTCIPWYAACRLKWLVCVPDFTVTLHLPIAWFSYGQNFERRQYSKVRFFCNSGSLCEHTVLVPPRGP